MANSSIVNTPARWFLRGVGVGILISAALNALSYFFRSDRGGNLLGLDYERHEALGFPVQVWESGNAYGGYFVDYPAVLQDAAFAVILGMLAGLFMLRHRQRLNRLVDAFDEVTTAERQANFQFSLRGLLLTTCLIAIAAALLRLTLAQRPEVLAAIYALGPWILVAIAFLPRRIPWRQRVMILIPTTLLLIAVAVFVGGSLKQPRAFDQTLMGIFICWTPQSTLAAVALFLGLLFWKGRQTSLTG